MSIFIDIQRMVKDWPGQMVDDRFVPSAVQYPPGSPEVVAEAIRLGFLGTFVSNVAAADQGKTFYYLKG